MPMDAKKTYCKKSTKQKSDSSKNHNESDKENIYSRLRKREKKTYRESILCESQSKDSEVKFEELLSSPLKQEVNLKPLSFWHKKLQDLESQKNVTKSKKHGLYDFSGTDDSVPTETKKKKRQGKAGGQKLKQRTGFRYKFEKPKPDRSKVKQQCKKSSVRDKVPLSKEKEILSDKDRLAYSGLLSSFGMTSTPAPNKTNVVEESNFMFLSPVKMDEQVIKCFNKDDGYQTLKSNSNTSCNKILCSESKTPKKQTRLNNISCKRVLRKRKIIGSN